LTGNNEIIKLLINYSIENNVNLNINNKNIYGSSPFLISCSKYSYDIFKFFIDYAYKHNVTLDINKKGTNGFSPLLYVLGE